MVVVWWAKLSAAKDGSVQTPDAVWDGRAYLSDDHREVAMAMLSTAWDTAAR